MQLNRKFTPKEIIKDQLFENSLWVRYLNHKGIWGKVPSSCPGTSNTASWSLATALHGVSLGSVKKVTTGISLALMYRFCIPFILGSGRRQMSIHLKMCPMAFTHLLCYMHEEQQSQTNTNGSGEQIPSEIIILPALSSQVYLKHSWVSMQLSSWQSCQHFPSPHQANSSLPGIPPDWSIALGSCLKLKGILFTLIPLVLQGTQYSWRAGTPWLESALCVRMLQLKMLRERSCDVSPLPLRYDPSPKTGSREKRGGE